MKSERAKGNEYLNPLFKNRSKINLVNWIPSPQRACNTLALLLVHIPFYKKSNGKKKEAQTRYEERRKIVGKEGESNASIRWGCMYRYDCFFCDGKTSGRSLCIRICIERQSQFYIFSLVFAIWVKVNLLFFLSLFRFSTINRVMTKGSMVCKDANNNAACEKSFDCETGGSFRGCLHHK